MYITTPDYGLDRTGTKQLKLHFYTNGITDTVTNIKVWVELRRCPIGGGANDWYVYANEDTNSNLQGSGRPLRYDYTTPSLPNGYYEATYTVRAYKLLIYQTYTYTTPMVSIY